jgi:hypothetical protein
MSGRPALYVLLGYPGTGKYTVGGALVRQLETEGEEVRFVDNHLVGNIVFGLIDVQPDRPLPAGTGERIRELNLAVLRTMETMSPPRWSFVLTHHLVASATNLAYLDRIAEVAAARASTFVPVVLTCEVEELVRRVPTAVRGERGKLQDPDLARRYVEEGMVRYDHPALLTLDVTTLAPEGAAAAIRAHAGALDPS